MNQKQRSALNKILNDKTSGSSELLIKINNLLFDTLSDKKTLKEISGEIQNKLSHFAILDNFFKDLKKILNRDNIKELEAFLKISSSENENYQRIAEKLRKRILNCKRIVTISRSGTFLNVISFADPKRKIEITVLESRPENEGRLTAKDLLVKGFKVKVITDAMMGYAIQNTDAVIIGADSVLKNGNVINKSGSLPLAVLCKKYSKPFYVVTTNSKFTSRQKFNVIKENSKAVWNYKQPKLTIDNFPFEEIDKNLISSIISE